MNGWIYGYKWWGDEYVKDGLIFVFLSLSLSLELLLVSYEVEPPDTPREKMHYQELKLV